MAAYCAEPKRFLFVAVPLHGHINPLLQPAQLLLQQGHSVAFACYEELQHKFEAAGIPFLSLGPDHMDFDKVGADTMDPFLPVEVQMQAAVRMFSGWEEDMHSKLLGVIAASGTPDVLVADIGTLSAFNVAEQLFLPLCILGSIPLGLALDCCGLAAYNAARHIPYEGAGVCFPQRMSLWQKYVANPRAKRVAHVIQMPMIEARNALRVRLGLPALPLGWGFFQPHPNVPRTITVMATSWLMETRRELPPDWHLVGAMGHDFTVNFPPPLEEGEIKNFLDEAQAAGQPAMLVALGTLVVLKQHQVQEMAAALAALPHIKFVWSLKQVCQAMLPAGYAPPNVFISSWVPQPGVLGHAGVKGFLSHGGQNSTNEGLAAGKPILCMPFGGDQPVNAQHIEDRSYGLQINPTQLTAKKLAATITKLLSSTKFTAAAAAAGKEMRSYSGPAETARLLASFAACGTGTAASTGLEPTAAAAEEEEESPVMVVDSASEASHYLDVNTCKRQAIAAAAAAPGVDVHMQPDAVPIQALA